MIREVTVYIPAYNVEPFLDSCIEGIRKQSYPVKEILVIDDGSKDRTLEIAKGYESQNKEGVTPVRVIRHPQNRGLAAVRNTGVQNAQTDYIASLDADCVPQPDWLEKLMPLFEKEKMAGVSGKLIEKNQKKMADRWRAAHMQQFWDREEIIIDPMHLFGNNTIFLKPALKEVGFYKDTPEYRTNNEDYYISRQLLEHGYHIAYDPHSIVYHLRTDSLYSLFRTYWRWFYLHRPRPDSKRGLWEKMKVNLQYFRMFLKQDLKKARWDIIPADFLFFFHQEYHDYQFALEARRKRRAQKTQ
jgi:glycosyltransferase involved in cell wall biosynthesis